MMRHTLLIERLNAKIGQDNEVRHRRFHCSIACFLAVCVAFSQAYYLWPELKSLLLGFVIGSLFFCMYCLFRVMFCASLIDERVIDESIDKNTIALLMSPDVCNEQEKGIIDDLIATSSHGLKYRCLFEMDEKTISTINKI